MCVHVCACLCGFLYSVCVCPLYRSIFGARGGGGSYNSSGVGAMAYFCKRGRDGRGQLERGQQTFSFKLKVLMELA